MNKMMRVFIMSFAIFCGLVLVFIFTAWSQAEAANVDHAYQGILRAAGQSPTLQNSCPVTTTVSGQIIPGTSPIQGGRLFRDGSASTCTGKAFPGMYNPGGLYMYETFGPYENYGNQDACVVVSYNATASGGCGGNAHLVAYQNSYDPNNQAINYLGDVGFSTSQPFSFTVPAGERFVLVAQETGQIFNACNIAFTVSQVPCQSTPLIEVSPSTISGIQLQETVMTHTLTLDNHGLPDLNWTLSSIPAWVGVTAPGGSTTANATSAVTVTYDASGLAAGVYTGSMTVNSNDPGTAQIQVPLTMTVQASVDLGISKIDTPDPVYALQPLTYTLEVTNHGVSDASGVVMTDTLPVGVINVAALSSQGSCNIAAGLVGCNLGSVTVGSSVQITISATAPNASGPITNQASVSGNETDPLPGNNSASAETMVIIPGDLELIKTADADSVFSGSTLIYELTVTNLGDQAINAVTLTDTLPAGVFHLSSTTSQGSCDYAAGTVTCSLGTVSSGSPVHVAISITAPPSGGLITNKASVSGNEFDPNLGNNTATVGTTVIEHADLSLSKQGNPDPVEVGQALTYTLVVNNLGASVASGVVLSDTLPLDVTYLSATASQGSCSEVSGTIVCSLGNLAAGNTALVEITVTAPMNPGLITNQATVTADQADLAQENNAARVDTNVVVIAVDLSLTMMDDPDPYNPGEVLTYTHTIVNNGPDIATGVTLTDTLPLNATFLLHSTGQGTCTLLSGVLVCELGSINPGASVQVGLFVLAPTTGATIMNASMVKANELDLNLADNNAVQETNAIVVSDLRLYLPFVSP